MLPGVTDGTALTAVSHGLVIHYQILATVEQLSQFWPLVPVHRLDEARCLMACANAP